jgi:hypothetical protein
METDGPLAAGAIAPASMVAAGQSGILYHFTIGNEQLVFNRGPESPLLFHEFQPGIHEFRLELRNEPPTGTYVFMFDGEVIDAGPAEGFYPTIDSFVIFGAKAAVVDSETRWDWIEFGPLVAETLSGDADADGDVDLRDYRKFEECLSDSGPKGETPGPSCLEPFDFDDDADVDVADFAGFQMAFTGSN